MRRRVVNSLLVMAIYHMSAKMHSRSAGASSVAAAAYRSGERLRDERTGETQDYTRRDGVEGTEIHAPEGAPEWAREREQLWNAVEAAERRKDAQVAREVEVALPVELPKEQQRDLARQFIQREFVERGMVADVAYHDGGGHNPHAHILLTTRTLGPQGFGGKERGWNSKELLSEWREAWARDTNQALERAGHLERIDHRSLAVQHQEAIRKGHYGKAEKLDRDPEPHYGKGAWMAARTGQANERTEQGAQVREINQGYQSERANGREWMRRIQYQIDRIVREAAERVRDLGRNLGRDFGFDR